ncbi:hypothetical protein [Rhodococcus sp. NPDC127528]|uniref:hypothetical protein n=1 Tax=unclassified Rhodococcus (in: high G+C Gram-positive bacteria) TaxID=192944 RepID=UPI00362A5A92
MWAKRIARGLLIGVGLVNLAPGVGVLSAARVEALYGVPVAGPDLELLLRHRAVLLATVGGGLLVAAFAPALRGAAVTAATTSMGSYVALAAAIGRTNEQSSRVLAVDIAALACVAVATAIDPPTRRRDAAHDPGSVAPLSSAATGSEATT